MQSTRSHSENELEQYCQAIRSLQTDRTTFFFILPRDINNELAKFICSPIFSVPDDKKMDLKCKIAVVGNNSHYVSSVPSRFARNSYNSNDGLYASSIDSTSVNFNYLNKHRSYVFFSIYKNDYDTNMITPRYVRASNALMICIDLNHDDCEKTLNMWADRWDNIINDYRWKKNFPISILLFNSEQCPQTKLDNIKRICEQYRSSNEIDISCYKLDLTKLYCCDLVMADLTNATSSIQPSVSPASLAAGAAASASVSLTSPASATALASVSPTSSASAAASASRSGMFASFNSSSSASSAPDSRYPGHCTLI